MSCRNLELLRCPQPPRMMSFRRAWVDGFSSLHDACCQYLKLLMDVSTFITIRSGYAGKGLQSKVPGGVINCQPARLGKRHSDRRLSWRCAVKVVRGWLRVSVRSPLKQAHVVCFNDASINCSRYCDRDCNRKAGDSDLRRAEQAPAQGSAELMPAATYSTSLHVTQHCHIMTAEIVP
jgi:hypothetical protein